MAIFPKITSIPPLRQLSVIPAGQEEVSFVLNMKWSTTRPDFPIEIHLCYVDAISQQHVSLWPTIPLERTSSQVVNLRKDENLHTACFVGKLACSSLSGQGTTHYAFTFKYRIDEDEPWQWFECPHGVERGEIIRQAPMAENLPISSVILLEPGWEAKTVSASEPGVALFSIMPSDHTSKGQATQGLEQKTLGFVKEQARFLAFAQLEPPWIGPRHGDKFFYLAEGAVLCSFLREDGNVVTITAPSVEDISALIHSNERGQIVVEVRDDADTSGPFRVVLSVAHDLEKSLQAIMHELRVEAKNSRFVRDMTETNMTLESSRSSYDTWLDGLAFCTWNGLGPDLTEEKIMQALKVLRDHGVTISTLLVDDNWQTLGPTKLDFSNPFYRGFADFKPTDGFPHGLEGMTSRIKREYPFISDIGVWHALLGYWGGIATKGWIVDNYETVDVKGKMYYAVPASLKSVAAKDLGRFYDDFYSFLASCGVTFVKTDVQCLVTSLEHKEDRAMLIPAYQSAWTTAHQRHFQGKATSCMSQVPEILWRVLLQDHTPPVVLRNSDDFFPDIPESHPWHLWTNAHNALFTQHLNAVLDWDMFQTSHEYGAYHAAARCLSGGPILITDTPREHDLGVINQMVAPSPDRGRSIALRPSPGKTPRAFDRYLESGVLRIVSETVTGVKLMGLFNTGQTPASLLISTADFANVGQSTWHSESEALFFSHQTQTPYGPLALGKNLPFHSDPASLILAELPVKGFDILSGYEVHRLPYERGDLLACVLGLLGKMTGAAAVCESVIAIDEEGKLSMSIRMKALGLLGIWISGLRLEKSQIQAKVEDLKLEEHVLEVVDFSRDGGESQVLQLNMLEIWSGRGRLEDGRKHVTIHVAIDLKPGR